jgi:hypothetical protein
MSLDTVGAAKALAANTATTADAKNIMQVRILDAKVRAPEKEVIRSVRRAP